MRNSKESNKITLCNILLINRSFVIPPQNVMRLALVALTGVVVSAVPNFAVLMSLIGATCCTLLAFILPAAFHLSIFRQ